MKKIIGLLIIIINIVSGCSCDDTVSRTSIYSSSIVAYLDKEKTTYTIVDPFGTIVSLSGYDEKKINKMQKKLDLMTVKYHSLLDRNYYYFDNDGNIINNIKVINDSYGSGQAISVDEIIIDVLMEGVKYTKISNGKFNIVSGSIVNVWDSRFALTTKWHVDPAYEEIETAMKCVPSANIIDDVLMIDEENNTVKFNRFGDCDNGASITLGAMAKSYFSDKMANIDELKKIDSYILNAGSSSILVKGKNVIRDNGEWIVQLKDSLHKGCCAVSVNLTEDSSLSTSSGDEKGYINGDGIRRHHIIDATSGYPNTYLLAASVVADDAMIADIVTTTLMTMNSLEEIKNYLMTLEDMGLELKVLLQIEDNSILKILVNESMNKVVNVVEDYTYEIIVEDFSYGA